MKLIVLACLAAAAMAQPVRPPRRSRQFSRARQSRLPTFQDSQQYQQPTYEEPQQYQPPSYEEPQQYQPPTYEEPEQYQQPTYEEPKPVRQQTYKRKQVRQRTPVEPETYEEQPQKTSSRRAPAKELSEYRKRDRDAVITSFSNEHTDSGAQHSFKADNGLQREETIQLREVTVVDDYGNEIVKTVPVFKGSFQFVMDDGSVVTRSYTTDETGHLIWEGSDVHPAAPGAPPAAPTYEYE